MFDSSTKILVCDDMRTMRMVMKKILKDLGYQNVVQVEDGKEGWQEIQNSLENKDPIQLVLSDWMMPNRTGLELLQQVREDAKTKDLPFLLVTAESEKDQVVKAIQNGVDNYLTKPFTADMVREKLILVFKKKQSEQQQAS